MNTLGDSPRDSPETVPKIARERTFSMGKLYIGDVLSSFQDEELKDELSTGSFTSEKSEPQAVTVQEAFFLKIE